jgi:hypothetical protein
MSPLGPPTGAYAAPAGYQSGTYGGGARTGAPVGVILPAIAMIVAAVPSLLLAMAFFIPPIFATEPGPVPPDIDPATWNIAMRVLPIIFLLICLLWYGGTIFGAVQMMRLRSMGAAKTAAILSIFPCSLFGIFGVAIGIWALVVLQQPQTKRMFRD